jgi:hypothetical protein
MSQSPTRGNPARRKGRKVRSPPAGNVESLRAIGGVSREEGAGRGICLFARCGTKTFPRGGGGQSRTRRGVAPRRAAEGCADWSSDRTAVSEATPELVRQDRKRDQRASALRSKVTNTGRSFARRRGGWQQCRPLTLCASSQSHAEESALGGKLPFAAR